MYATLFNKEMMIGAFTLTLVCIDYVRCRQPIHQRDIIFDSCFPIAPVFTFYGKYAQLNLSMKYKYYIECWN